ncbi:MAG: glycoside hydrolase family 3 C-terminal domain-containing protein, partial [Abditibacteriota bacterium]|nr:glycoside hydrolase family 3 C-terminal domain-containing protein [Abditibacteriota bacterium]
MDITKQADATLFPVTREVAREGIVLLRNDRGALPLKGGKVALAGNGAEKLIPGGCGSARVNAVNIATMPEAFKALGVDFEICTLADIADSDADTAVLVFTHDSTEGGDRYAEKGDWFISDENESLLKAASGKFDKIIVVLNVPCVIDTSWADEYPVDAIVLPYQPGQEGAYAIAEIITGKVNPSGKTVDTWAKDINDYPSTSCFQQELRTVDYEEDIFVGYRYFSTFDPEYKKVRFPFGFGLSFTAFEISDIDFTFGDKVEASVTVTNTGKVAGKEVVQVYCKAPQGKLGKAAMVLTAFAKTKLLEPGESETLNIAFDYYNFASYDDTGKTGNKSCYVLEEGVYEFYVGNSVKDASGRLAASYEEDECVVLEQLSERLTPSRLPKVLRADGSYEKLSDFDEIGDRTVFIKNGFGKLNSEDAVDCSERFTLGYGETGDCSFIYFTQTDAHAYYATYKLNVDKAGRYFMRLRCRNVSGETFKDFATFSVNGKDTGIKLDMPSMPKGGGNGTYLPFENVGDAEIDLPAGEVDFRIEFREGQWSHVSFILFAADKADLDKFEADNPNLYGMPPHIDESKINPGCDKGITADMLRANPALMEEFIDQFSDRDLCDVVTRHLCYVPGSVASIGAVDKFGIVDAHTFDGPCGVRMHNSDITSTAWPSPILVSSGFNPDIADIIGNGVAKESNARGLSIWLSPALNIHRSPLCGRNFEYFSEDPLVAGKFAAA